MKNALKLMRRCVVALLLSSVLIVVINVIIFISLIATKVPKQDTSPYNIARETGQALQLMADGTYVLTEEMASKLEYNNAWAILIKNSNLQVGWKSKNVPNSIASQFNLSDIADLSTGYLQGYPTYVGENYEGIVVVGFPQNSFWKHTQPSWDYELIANLPKTILMVLLVNVVFVLLVYAIINIKFIGSVKPVIKGIQDLSLGESVYVPEKGILSEICKSINLTSNTLQEQKKQLRRKETARANWIAGVSHDIRTPLSMVMGYAGQLEKSPNLSQAEQKKTVAIIEQSIRIRSLISNLNLASKLEYNMQPLNKKMENAIAVVRQVVADFVNTNVDERYLVEWKTADELNFCSINVDKELLQRAIYNLLQNCIYHNESGCSVYVTVTIERDNCVICIEDDGVGVSEEEMEKLNTAPHYMICDTNTTEQRHGLGLLLVKQITENHGGKVVIDHSQYGGLKVSLSIPIPRQSENTL